MDLGPGQTGTGGEEPPIISTLWALLTLQKVAPPPTVPVDIKPGSCPNPLNGKSKGVLPVAIFGTASLDVKDVDPSAILLSLNGNGGVSPLRGAYADVATPYFPFTGKEDCLDCNELCGDGETDLVLNFDTQEVEEQLGPRTRFDGERQAITALPFCLVQDDIAGSRRYPNRLISGAIQHSRGPLQTVYVS